MKFEIAPKSTEIQSNWHNAIAYCDSLNIGGKTGWRLPNKAELNEIYQSENDFVHGDYYWSSTELTDMCAWDQSFSDGFHGVNGKGYSSNYVRAIRSTV